MSRPIEIGKEGYVSGLQSDLSLIVMWTLVAVNFARGLDYATGEQNLRALSPTMGAMDISLWGVVFLVSAAMLTWGLASRSFNTIIAASVVSAAAYAILAVSHLWGTVSGGWPFDEFRGSVVYLFFAVISACYAYGAYLKKYVWGVEELSKEEESTANGNADPTA